MAENSGISWTDKTFAPWHGCTKVSPACDFCYAENLDVTRFGRVVWGPHGERLIAADSSWAKLKTWDRKAAKQRALAGPEWQPPFVFTNHLGDIFDKQAPLPWRVRIFEEVRDTPNLLYLMLTKRPQNIVRMVKQIGFMPPNIAFGTTCEDEARKRLNLPALMVAAGLRPAFLFASFEPLLGDIGDLTPWLSGDPRTNQLAPGERWEKGFKIGADGWPKLPALGWCISGGETNQGKHRARPWDVAWARNIRDQAAMVDCPYHHKQNGEHITFALESPSVLSDALTGGWLVRTDGRVFMEEKVTVFTRPDGSCGITAMVGKKLAGRLLDGVLHDARPVV